MIDQPLGDTISRSTLPAPPKTRGLPLVGSLPALVRRSFDFLLAARARYGDIYTAAERWSVGHAAEGSRSEWTLTIKLAAIAAAR